MALVLGVVAIIVGKRRRASGSKEIAEVKAFAEPGGGKQYQQAANIPPKTFPASATTNPVWNYQP